MTPLLPNRLARRLALLAVVWPALAAAAAPAPGSAHATRTGAAVAELEQALLHAVQSRDAGRLQQLLTEDFEMTVAQDPDNPVPRDDWIDSAMRTGAAGRTLAQLAAREVGTTVLATFVLHGKPALFVVDTWQRDGASWRLAARQVAATAGTRRGIPGDAVQRPVRKKI